MLAELFHIALILATLLCTLVTGLVFGFAVVVMPGLAKLSDRELLLAFKHIDGIIQDQQAAFMIVWVGSIAAIITMMVLGTLNISGTQLYLMWFASVLYLLGVQLPTIRFNIPLNNGVQALDIDNLSESDLAQARTQFEAPWNRWNRIRTMNGMIAVAALLVLLSGRWT